MKLESLCKIVRDLYEKATLGETITIELTPQGLRVVGKRHEGLFTVKADRSLSYSLLDDMDDALAVHVINRAINHVKATMNHRVSEDKGNPSP